MVMGLPKHKSTGIWKRDNILDGISVALLLGLLVLDPLRHGTALETHNGMSELMRGNSFILDVPR